jgi:hypothetical protein
MTRSLTHSFRGLFALGISSAWSATTSLVRGVFHRRRRVAAPRRRPATWSSWGAAACLAGLVTLVPAGMSRGFGASYEFYASKWANKIVGIAADYSVTSFGATNIPADERINDFTYDSASGQFLMTSQLVVGAGPYPSYLNSLTIDPDAGTASSSLIGLMTNTAVVEGGLAFNSSLTGSRTLYAAGYHNTGSVAGLWDVNATTGAATNVYTLNPWPNAPDLNSLWTAPDGTLWTLASDSQPTTTTTYLQKLGPSGVLASVSVVAGAHSTAGVTLGGDGTTYGLLSQGSDSRLGTFGWDAVNSTYDGTWTQLATIPGTDFTGLYAVNAVPEPSTMLLAGMGIAGAVVRQVRRRKKLAVRAGRQT